MAPYVAHPGIPFRLRPILERQLSCLNGSVKQSVAGRVPHPFNMRYNDIFGCRLSPVSEGFATSTVGALTDD